MFGLLRFRYKIWSLEKDIRKISKAYETDIKNARKQKASSAEMKINGAARQAIGVLRWLTKR